MESSAIYHHAPSDTHVETRDTSYDFFHRQVIRWVGNYLRALMSILIGVFSKNLFEDNDSLPVDIQSSQKSTRMVSVILGGPTAGGPSHVGRKKYARSI